MDDIGLHARGEPGERRRHPEAPQHRDAEEGVELLELMHLDPLELAAGVDSARGDMDLMAALGEAARPPREMARLGIADPEDAEPAVRRHRRRA